MKELMASLCVLALSLASCQGNNNEEILHSNPYTYSGVATFDYYEIADNSIVSTLINTSYFNVAYIINATQA
ncbi:MAG: hypothetical protein Q9M34_01470, partial [Sulfurimonas sp.]|nr:hypothetical protein [Sulfurimonas sp.]